MAITSNIVVKEYTADGVVTDFPTTYLIYLKSDVKVEVDGVLQIEGTDYIVTSLGTVNAQVKFTIPPADTTKVKLIKNNPYTQNIDLINGQKFNADNIEKALDITTMLSQQTLYELKKTPKAPSTVPEGFDGEMSSIVPLGLVRFKADSTGFESVTPAEAALSGTYTMTDGNILVGDGTSFVEESGATARTSLGLGSISTQAASAVTLTGGTIAGLSSLGVSGNITVTGLVDGVDVAGLKTDLDGFPDELKTLTASEIGELGNIGAVTISTTQWGYLGSTDQGVATTDSPSFVNGDFSGTEALKVPVGTTAERPASPVDGDMRINTTIGNLEVYRDTAWRSLEAGGGTMSNLVEDTTPQLGGNLDVNGNSIVSVSAGAISITPDTTGDIILDGLKWPQADGTSGQLLTTDGAAQLSWTSAGGSGITNTMTSDIAMAGFQLTSPDGTDLLDIPNGSIDLQTASTSRLDITDTGVRLGAANARVTTILDEDNMASNSATALATQQSIKAYVDAAGGSGSMILLATATASTSASIDFITNIDATYDHYELHIINLRPAIDGVDIYLRTSTDGGFTFDSGASDYVYTTMGYIDGGATNAFSTGTTFIRLSNTTVGNVAGESFSGIITILDPADIKPCQMNWQGGFSTTGTANSICQGTGRRVASANVDGVRIYTSSGNITSGKFKLYGIKKA